MDITSQVTLYSRSSAFRERGGMRCVLPRSENVENSNFPFSLPSLLILLGGGRESEFSAFSERERTRSKFEKAEERGTRFLHVYLGLGLLVVGATFGLFCRS